MLSKGGLLQNTLGAANAEGGPATSNDGGPDMPTRQQLEALRRSCDAIEGALESIAAPAFLIDRTGAVQQANAAGRGVLSHDAASLTASLAAAVGAGRSTDEWALAPLSEGGAPGLFLALLRARAPRAATSDPIQLARQRWKLTARQTQVLDLVARGLTNALVAETLDIGEGTVEFHLTSLFDKAGVCNRATLIVRMLDLARR